MTKKRDGYRVKYTVEYARTGSTPKEPVSELEKSRKRKAREAQGVPWPLVILLLILVWPVGLALLIWKYTHDSSVPFSGVVPLAFAGLFLTLLGGVSLGAILTEGQHESLPIVIMFLAGGVIVLGWTVFLFRDKVHYKKYIQIVATNGITNIDEIAKAHGAPRQTIEQDLQKMIDKGYFAAYIDKSTRELVFANDSPIQIPEKEYIAIHCPRCGAPNRIPVGGTVQCEYCKSWLKG